MAYDSIVPCGKDTGAPLNLSRRIKYIQRYIDLPGTKILDCGCGTGQYLEAFLRLGADAYGIEHDGTKVKQFQTKFPDFAHRVQQGDIEAMEFPQESFDLVLLNEVLEHVPNEDRALQEIYRVLKPDGMFILFAPNRLYPFETHSVSAKNGTLRIPIYFPFIPYIPLNIGQKLFRYVARNYWPHELRQLVRAKGFTIVNTGYIWQTFENISRTQPKFMSLLKPFLRQISLLLEQVPVLNAFGISQVIIAKKQLKSR